jgi:hypothetical protein
MSIRLSPWLVIPVVAAAAIGGYLVADRSPSSAGTAPEETAAAATAAAAPVSPAVPSGALPPNHPQIGDMSGHPGPQGGAMPGADSQAAIVWTPPSTWQVLPNPSPMRLATYKVSDAAELSVARVGGSVDANVQRWVGQFDGSPKADLTEKQVSGMKVTVVRIAGTFLGGGMGGAAPEKKDGWAMLAAVVESTGAPYFFKLLGPADQVDHARAAFDQLVASVKPHGSP